MSNAHERVRHEGLRSKIMTADQAEFIHDGMTVGISGFTGAGYPKALPTAIANRAKQVHADGKSFGINMLTGASTAPECDGVLAEAGAIKFRSPFQSDPTLRNSINAGNTEYQDMHLSHVEQQIRQGFYGEMQVAIIEATGITEDGKIIPSMGIGNNNEILKVAKQVIIEVNVAQNTKLEGMHDIQFDIGTPPNRQPIQIIEPFDRIGTPYLECDLDKIVAIVITDGGDRNSKFAKPDDTSKRIAKTNH